eukprot:344777-Heterocapsa_arctica.AAC.1
MWRHEPPVRKFSATRARQRGPGLSASDSFGIPRASAFRTRSASTEAVIFLGASPSSFSAVIAS